MTIEDDLAEIRRDFIKLSREIEAVSRERSSAQAVILALRALIQRGRRPTC